MTSLPVPSGRADDPAPLLTTYLSFLRAEVERKVRGLDHQTLRTSRLPSGWTPLEMLSHLVHMEQRWMVWGFLGEQVAAPWGDQGADGRWSTDVDVDELVQLLHAGGRRTTGILADHLLEARASTGGRFDDDPPTLLAISFHVLQEYARHLGHLDVARELADGLLGEDPSA